MTSTLLAMIDAGDISLAGTRGRDPVLSGGFADSAALYGMLAQLEALDLELPQLRRVEL